jgi:hypothetical protein
MKPTYIDLFRARRNVAATLYLMWNFAEANRFEVAMAMHFEFLYALDELDEIQKSISLSESVAQAEAYVIAYGWKE